MSGIYRDVYILKRPECAIRDYYIRTDVDGANAKISVDIRFSKPVYTKIRIEDKAGACVAVSEICENGNEAVSLVLKNNIERLCKSVQYHKSCIVEYGESIFI